MVKETRKNAMTFIKNEIKKYIQDSEIFKLKC